MTVSAKRIRVSDDAGTTWYTLPGSTGTFTDALGSVDDTIFGQDYKSMQPTSIDGKISSNAFYKGFAGYVATIKKAGTSTATTGEATTLVSGKTYQVTAPAKRVMDRSVAIVVKDNAVDHTANVVSIDYLFGEVTFASGYTVTGPVTIDYHYLPLASITKSNNFTLTQTAESVDNSDFDTLQGNEGHKTYQQGLKTVELEIKGFHDNANDLQALIESRAELVIELNPDGGGASVCRGFFRPGNLQLSGNVGKIEDSTIKFSLTVPDDDLLVLPFEWVQTSTTLSIALLKTLTAWVDGSDIAVQYLPDGTNGYEAATCVVTEISLSGGVDAINTFSVGFQISGAAVVTP